MTIPSEAGGAVLGTPLESSRLKLPRARRHCAINGKNFHFHLATLDGTISGFTGSEPSPRLRLTDSSVGATYPAWPSPPTMGKNFCTPPMAARTAESTYSTPELPSRGSWSGCFCRPEHSAAIHSLRHSDGYQYGRLGNGLGHLYCPGQGAKRLCGLLHPRRRSACSFRRERRSPFAVGHRACSSLTSGP